MRHTGARTDEVEASGGSVERYTDERLMDLLKRGETRALDDLYRRYARNLYAFFRSAGGLRTSQDAEDAVHDVFMRVIKGAGNFDPSKASFRTWVSRVARNYAIDAMRRRDRAKTVSIGRPSEPDACTEDLVSQDALPDQAESTETRLIKSATAQAVRDCVGELENEDERQAIVLYYLYDKVYREIGEIFGDSTSMARNRVKSAQTKVRECLERKGVAGC